MNPIADNFAATRSPGNARLSARVQSSRGNRRGFTLVEVLATLLLMAIALPVILEGVAMTSGAAVVSQRRAQAAALAEAKLNELCGTTPRTAGSSFQLTASSGDFPAEINGSPSPFTWTAEVSTWTSNMGVPASNVVYELDVHVMWVEGAQQRTTTASTLVYISANTSTSAASSGTGGT